MFGILKLFWTIAYGCSFRYRICLSSEAEFGYNLRGRPWGGGWPLQMKWPSSCRYDMSAYTWPVRTRNRLAAFPLTGPPQIRKVCTVFFFFSLSLSRTPLLPVNYCFAVHGLSWQTSGRDRIKITCRRIKKNEKKNACVFRSMTICRHWFLGNDWPDTWPIADDTPSSLVYFVIVLGNYCYYFFNSHITYSVGLMY